MKLTNDHVFETIRNEVYISTKKLAILLAIDIEKIRPKLAELQLAGKIRHDSADDIWTTVEDDNE